MQNQSNVKNHPPVAETLSYAQSLRAIGQALDALRLNSFELRKNSADYILIPTRSAFARKRKAITEKLWGRVDQSMRHALDLKGILITSSDIDRLDTEGRSRRGSASGRLSRTANFSLSLRMIGDFLDEKQAVTFSITWSPDLVMVQYQTPNGIHRVQDFTTQNLYDRDVHERADVSAEV